MFSPPFFFFAATAVYLSSYFLIHILSSSFAVPYLHSEWLCWSFLLLAAKLIPPFNHHDQDVKTQPDKLALAIAAVCALRTIGGVDWAFVCGEISLAHPPTDPLLLVATAHAIVAAHHTPSLQHKPSTRVSREGSAGRDSLPPWTLCLAISTDPCPDPCPVVCGLASTSPLFSMADLRRSLLRPCPHGRLHVDTRTRRRTLVRTGSPPNISTLCCNIMADFSCPDHDVAHCAQKLLANKILRARHLGCRCDAEGSTMGHGHGIGQSPPSCSVDFALTA